jgi:hypothetical protein
MEPGQTHVIGRAEVVFPQLPTPPRDAESRAAAIVALPLRKGMTQRCAGVTHQHRREHPCDLPIPRFGVAHANAVAVEKVHVQKPRNFVREEQAGPLLLHVAAATPGVVSMRYSGRECVIGSTKRIGIAVEPGLKFVPTLVIAGEGVQIVELRDTRPRDADHATTHILRGVSELAHRSEHTRRMA